MPAFLIDTYDKDLDVYDLRLVNTSKVYKANSEQSAHKHIVHPS